MMIPVYPNVPSLDIGTLKNDPVRVYDLCMRLFDFESELLWDTESEVYKAFKTVCFSLWSALPPVVVMDFRDPDDSATWGIWGKPPGIPPENLG